MDSGTLTGVNIDFGPLIPHHITDIFIKSDTNIK